MQTLTSFKEAGTSAEFDRPRPDRLVHGNPLRTTWNHYQHAGMSAGTWACEAGACEAGACEAGACEAGACEAGAWRIAFAAGKDEFFHVLEGRIRITDAGGAVKEFGPGDACVIPGGFTGLFEVIEPVRKHYVIVDREAG